jgi:ubiquinone/menaquinone biosynthesis C-methylase UbiE
METDEFYNNYYKNLDKEFIEWRKLGAKTKSNNCIRISKDHNFGTVIEIGCGTGAILKNLSEKSFANKYYAIDISKSAVEYVKTQKIKDLDEVKKGSAYEIPYEDKKFDLSIMSHVLEHLDNPDIALEEAKRVSKFLIIEIPLEDNIFRNLLILFLKFIKLDKNFQLGNDLGHIIFFNKNSAKKLVESHGFRILNAEIIYPSKDQLFYNKKSIVSKLKAYTLLNLLYFSKKIGLQLVSTHYIMLLKA